MIKPIVLYPDPRLKKQSLPVEKFNEELVKLSVDMIDTMNQAAGVGLAAVQIGELIRMMVMNVNYESDDKEGVVLCNPEILETNGTELSEEGCLSIPNVREEIERALEVKVRAYDLQGKEKIWVFKNLLARCIQHEIDHMNGQLFIEKIPAMRRLVIQPQLKQLKKKFSKEIVF
jgi:peptide deformylase